VDVDDGIARLGQIVSRACSMLLAVFSDRQGAFCARAKRRAARLASHCLRVKRIIKCNVHFVNRPTGLA